MLLTLLCFVLFVHMCQHERTKEEYETALKKRGEGRPQCHHAATMALLTWQGAGGASVYYLNEMEPQEKENSLLACKPVRQMRAPVTQVKGML